MRNPVLSAGWKGSKLRVETSGLCCSLLEAREKFYQKMEKCHISLYQLEYERVADMILNFKMSYCKNREKIVQTYQWKVVLTERWTWGKRQSHTLLFWRDMVCKSKTSCFTVVRNTFITDKVPSNKVKQVVLPKEKRHDIFDFNVMPSNRLIINKIKENMTF